MKKRFVSMLLALTLVVSGMPVGITAEGVHAAEISESEVVAETEETQDAVEDKDAYKEELHSEAGDLYAFNVSADGKAVGSDGVVYDDVAYLSADTVKSFGAEGQSAYVEICDQIAEEKNVGDYFENAVIAVDEEGNLIVQRKVSMKLLQTLMRELTEEAFEDEEIALENKEDNASQVDEKVKELSIQENIEEDAADDNSDDKGLHNEASDNKNVFDEINTEEESSKVEASVEKEASSTEEIANDAMTDECTEDSETLKEDTSTEVTSVEEEEFSSEENLTEATETTIDEFVLSAENMELVDEPQVEEFEVVENAKADLVIDLGYGKTGDAHHFNSILPTNDYFYNQLTEDQKKIYNASKVLGKGTNKFTLTTLFSVDNIYRAISAYVISEPYKCDWMDTTGKVVVTDWYTIKTDANGNELSRKYDHTIVTLPKSKYYTSKIQKDANAKVLEIAAQAQEYAVQNYSNSPVYGIVKYFDKWICENHYYDMQNGTLTTADMAIDEDGQVVIRLSEAKAKPYYYCHSSYGVLLEDYGVCEGYALAMTRLLDAVGIPNIYAIGDALDKDGNSSGGHAWNYIKMPDGKWYLQDSTWNEVDVDTPTKVDSPSTEEYLLCADDTNQPYGRIPNGNRWSNLKEFTFESRSSSKYEPAKEEIILSLKDSTESGTVEELNLLVKKSKELTYDNGKNTYIMNESIPKVWTSSNEKIVKVDKNGKVTAVAPGSAEVTLTAAGITATCKVNVHQISSITFDEGGKASLTTSCGIIGGTNEKKAQNISLTVNQKAEVYTAEQLNDKNVFDDFEVKSLDDSIVKISDVTLKDNNIEFVVTPENEGKTKVAVTFGTKKATLTVSVGKMLDETWFKLDEVKKLVDEGKDGTLLYTGKAYKPKVELSDSGKDEKVKFKVSYLNNKDAGTASVIITGNGKYGGKLRYDFKINPLVLNVDTSSIKVSDKPVLYNGGPNLTKSTVKHLNETGKKVSLKAGKDYDILYTKGTVTTAEPKEVGEYTMTIVGKGNYSGGVNAPVAIEGNKWTIVPNDVKKAKVKVTVNGRKPTVTVMIGKNGLFEKTDTKDGDYKMTFYKDKACQEKVTSFAAKTQYFVKIEGVGSNLTNEKPIVKSFKTK